MTIYWSWIFLNVVTEPKRLEPTEALFLLCSQLVPVVQMLLTNLHSQ
jgi:hypothetical protein